MAGKRPRKDVRERRSAEAVKAHQELRKKMTDELRSLYNSVLEEPLPDSMMNFLRDLDDDDENQGNHDNIDRDDSGN